MPAIKQLGGRRFGRWFVVFFMGRAKNGNACWLCRCDCGTHRIVRSGNLLNGSTRSCGCLSKETAKSLLTTHGQTLTREYRAWQNMKDRCLNPKNTAFKHYGGRGITICKRWLKFESFLADMGKAPSPKHTLDRIDNDGPYSKKNCRWATKEEQQNNTRHNVLLTYKGRTKSLAQWSKETGINEWTLRGRRSRGWSTKRMLEAL